MKRFVIGITTVFLLAISCSAISYREYLDILGVTDDTDEYYADYIESGFENWTSEDVRNYLGIGLSNDLNIDYTPISKKAFVNIGSSAEIQNIPTSGSSYSDPVLISTEYASADSGSLLSILYSMFGRPVTAYHYRYQSSNSTTQYAVQTIDYDANWFASVVVFIIILWCLFKLGGVLLSKT